jgi:hypothetical protein
MGDNGNPKATPATETQPEDWRKIAERASKETNPEKLLSLVQELCAILEQRTAERKRDETPKP